MSLRLLHVALASLLVALAAAPAGAAVLDEINTHTAAGKTVFVVLTDATVKTVETARAAAKAAHLRTPDSAVVELNRSDPAHQPAVAKYRVAGAPVPLVLVIAPNGLAVGAAHPGAPGALDRLVDLVPTPAKAEYLKILNDRHVAVVVFSRRSMPEESPLFEQISVFGRTPDLKARTVLIDLDDAKEKRFIAQWKLDLTKVTRPLVIFVDPKARIIGSLEGAPKAAQMLEMSRKKVKTCGCGNPKCKGH